MTVRASRGAARVANDAARSRTRRRVQRFSLVCFYCGHEAGTLTSLDDARRSRCPRCGGKLAIEADAVGYAATLTEPTLR